MSFILFTNPDDVVVDLPLWKLEGAYIQVPRVPRLIQPDSEEGEEEAEGDEEAEEERGTTTTTTFAAMTAADRDENDGDDDDDCATISNS